MMTVSIAARHAGMAGILLGLCACATIEPYRTPEVAPPARWTAAETAPGPSRGAAWWGAFGSPELTSLMDAAAEDNIDLQMAMERLQQAEAEARIAGAARRPELSAGFEAVREPHSGGQSGDEPSGGISNTFISGLRVAYQLDLFGRTRAEAAAAGERVKASSFAREAAALTVQAEAASLYFRILASRDRRRAAEDAIQDAAGILDLLLTREKAGGASGIEAAQQRAAIAEEQAALPALALEEKQMTRALALLIGRDPDNIAVSLKSLDQLTAPPVAQGLPSELLLRRPDIRQSEAELPASYFTAAAAHAARFPSIALTAEGGVASHSLSSLFDIGSVLYALDGNLTAPLLAGGRLAAGEALNLAKYHERALAYRRSALTAFREVEDALDETLSAHSGMTLRREAYDRAREALAMIDSRYRAGATDFQAVLEAQRGVARAARNRVQATADRFAALIDLYKALGGGWTASVSRPDGDQQPDQALRP